MVVETLSGSIVQDVQDKIDSYLRNYHPLGYGTYVRVENGETILKSESGDGFFAVVCRYNHCD